MNESQIFAAALKLTSPLERAAYLDAVCAGNAQMRADVEALLRAQADDPGFLEQSPVSLGGTGDVAPADRTPGDLSDASSERPGVLLAGRYKLLEQIGEGGMGAVWMAQQTEPVKRLVAVKLIKAGMDSKQIIARFEAERQALALMDHPNIAKVHDAGTTPDGRLFFVMELVKGVPITKYCDAHHLTPRQRLELFVPVCQAIQHAHTKGVIHRDVKPSNVLVALYDDKPVPKVIDFGVAKATGQQLTEQTLHTGFGTVVGTVEYMSPEQASFNQLDVDTRSDVYSLGVLLYELLTGSPPFTRRELEKAGMLEMLRVIREQDPSKPSTKLSTADRLPTLASYCGMEPKRLAALLRGELDWIVLKSLEKDRNRRYETANGFAMDVQRYLADEPVQACPPTAGYRLRKFARRNKTALTTVALIALALVLGAGISIWQAVRATDAEQNALAAARAERKAKEAEAEQRQQAEDAQKKAVREAAIAAAVNDFLNKDLLQLAGVHGQAARGLKPDADLKLRTVLQRAASRIDGRFLDQPEVEMRLRATIGYALTSAGDFAGGLAQYEKVVPYQQNTLGHNDPATLISMHRLANLYKNLGQPDKAVSLHEQVFERRKTLHGPVHDLTLHSMNSLAMAYRAAGQKDKALQWSEQTLELRKSNFGPHHLDTLVSMNNLGLVYKDLGQWEKGLVLLEEALKILPAKLGETHPETLNTMCNLALAYRSAERPDRAIPLLEEAVRSYKTTHGPDHYLTLSTVASLLALYVEMGWCDRAEALMRSAPKGEELSADLKRRQELTHNRLLELIQQVKPAADKYQKEFSAKKADHPDTLAARLAFAVALKNQKRTSAAAYHTAAVLDARRHVQGSDHLDTLTCQLELGKNRLGQKRYAEAEPLLIEGYEGLKRAAAMNPTAHAPGTDGHNLLRDNLKQMVRLYDGWGKKADADRWREELKKVPLPVKPLHEK